MHTIALPVWRKLRFTARVAGNVVSEELRYIWLYLDSPDSYPVASCAVPVTAGWQDWKDVSSGLLEKVTGKHDLYLKFTGGEGYLFNLNSFVFSNDPVIYYCLGDMNLDNLVNSEDILIYLKYMFGVSELNEDEFSAADINLDGKCDITDLVLLKNLILETD